MTTTNATDIFAEYDDGNASISDMISAGYNYYVTGLNWITIDEENFLGEWIFTEEMYYSQPFFSSTEAAFKSFEDGMTIYAIGSTGFTELLGALEEANVKTYWPSTGENNNPPSITETRDVGEDNDSSALDVDLDDVETEALKNLYRTTTEETLQETFTSNVKELAASITLATVDIEYTFKKISSPKLVDFLSAFEAGETEGTEAVSVSTTKLY